MVLLTVKTQYLMTEYMGELQKIQTQVNSYDKDRKKYENVIDLLEEGSQYSDSMVECLKEYEVKLEQLDTKRHELKVLTQVANQNDEEIENMRKSIDAIRGQRERMKQIINSKVLPNKDAEPIQDSRSTLPKNDTLGYYNLSSEDSFRSLKEDVKEENRQILELRQEIQLLKQRLYEKEAETGLSREVNRPNNLSDKLDSAHDGKDTHEEQSRNYLQGINGIPLTLNLNSTSADFSALGTSYHKTQHANDRALVGNIQGTQKPSNVEPYSLDYKRQTREKYDYLNQADSNPDRLIQFEGGITSKNHRDYDLMNADRFMYDLSEHPNVVSMKSSTRRHTKKKVRGTSSTKAKKDICEDICAGATGIVHFLRKIFGTKRDPVVRQW